MFVEWQGSAGRTFRVGYYSRQDGLDCVWLVNDAGEYEQTTDQKGIRAGFDILQLSDETDLFEVNREAIQRIGQ